MLTYAFGFPRLGENREFKTSIERFWRREIVEKELLSQLNRIEKDRIDIYKSYVDYFPLGEFTYYDNILDTALIFGVYKFRNLEEYFGYARGKRALSLKKYFNTNYHYLVPLIGDKSRFKLSWNKPLFYFNTFFSFKDCPIYMVGPYSFLKLSDLKGGFATKFGELVEVYKQLFSCLYNKGVHFIHLEEPAFVLDISEKEKRWIVSNYKKLLGGTKIKVNLITYYESVDFLNKLYDLSFYSIGLDFIDSEGNFKHIKKYGFPKDKRLICGIIDGRNPFRADIFEKVKILEKIRKISSLNEGNIWISNSCPLFHLPFSVMNETNISLRIKNRISFAKERLYELSLIRDVFSGRRSREAKQWSRYVSSFNETRNKKRNFSTLSLKEEDFPKRRVLQDKILKLPLFPTTTIGSFPQDRELRKYRRDFKRGIIKSYKYDKFIKNKIKQLVKFQEDVGIDVLVHGEFERSDMVEFFAENLKGFVTTQQGWVISYGTRVYRPPLIVGEIKRYKSITSKEILFAQRLTSRPVKGIFTGPVTIIAWSYYLRNTPVYNTAFELAKALNEEAKDLVKKGIRIIQIDEPAIREYKPLKSEKEDFYFSWAIRAFNLTAKLPAHIQIHTHMCYSEFGDILSWILKMNFDVITVEAAREEARIIDAFRKKRFLRQIGPGVWDIHSKLPAQEKRVKEILDKAGKVFDRDKIWINPDCGLKTRDWPEVEESLKVLVRIAKEYRAHRE